MVLIVSPKRVKANFCINFAGIKTSNLANAFFDNDFGSVVKKYLEGEISEKDKKLDFSKSVKKM